MKTKTIYSFLIFLLLTGCASSPERIKSLEAQAKNLSASLEETKNRVAVLEKEKAELGVLLQQQQDVAQALGKEKEAHISQAGDLRQNMRAFLNSQITSLRDFSQRVEFLDYVGGELIRRQYLEGKDLTLIDLKNKIPSGGSLFGAWGHFKSPCTYFVSVLRKVNEQWFVVWQTDPFDVLSTNLQKFDFRVPVSVEKGDVIAYTFRGIVGVTYDRGTGETLYVGEELKTGRTIGTSEFKGESDKRAYSLGVVGMFE
jgi:hypothetical protein